MTAATTPDADPSSADACAENPFPELGPAQALDAAALVAFGPTLVLVPHPDDETLGCGGLIARLVEAGVPVTVALVTDGTGSHPGSRTHPPAARRALRARELREALTALGVSEGALHELGWSDGALPGPGVPDQEALTAALAALCVQLAPRTVVLPWRRDPHPDHRAVHAAGSAACARLSASGWPQLVEYLVWTAERGDASTWPQPGEARVLALDVRAVLPRKLAALAAHRSQLGEVILDDPGGFTLPAGLRERAAAPCEWFLEGLPPGSPAVSSASA